MATKHHPGTTVQQLLHPNWHHMLSVWLTFWIYFICMQNPVLPEVIYRVDPLALLAATLRTYQRAGCDSEQLSLSCPRGTSISIELAQYGRAGDSTDHSLCPPISPNDITTTGTSSSNADGGVSGISSIGSSSGTDVIHSSTQVEVKPVELCTVSGLQYTLLQTVVDACQKKRHCKFAANSKPLESGDPCAGIRKFVEIAYKCRPYEFRSKVACENDNMPLVCNPYSRIAIYSASFGFIERESVQCPHNNTSTQNANSKQTCLVSYATETVMQICHGRRRCSITADAGTFARPCNNDVPMYLKVVYTCIPRKVLKDRYETAPEPDEPQQSELDLQHDELYDEDQFYKEGETIPPAPKLQGAIPHVEFPYDFNMRSSEPTTTLMPSILSRNDNSLEGNQELFYLYLIISVSVSMLLCVTLIIGRLTIQRRRICRKNSLSSNSNERNEKSNSNKMGSGVAGDSNKFQHEPSARETQLSGSFADDISDIDADIDLTSPMPVISHTSRNETYLTHAPIPNCTYGSLGDHSAASYGTPTTMLMPSTSQHNNLMMPAGHNSINSSGKPLGCPTMVGSRQTTPPPPTSSLYTNIGVCSPSVSGTMIMGPHVLAPSTLSATSNQNIVPSYLKGTLVESGALHPHTGTLRRQLIPTSMGMMRTSPSPLVGGNAGPHSIVGVPTSSGVYYDSTIPRQLNRGLSADNTQYFYG